MEAAIAQTVRSNVEVAYARRIRHPLALDEDPDHGFPAALGVAHRDQAAVGVGPDVVALWRQPGRRLARPSFRPGRRGRPVSFGRRAKRSVLIAVVAMGCGRR